MQQWNSYRQQYQHLQEQRQPFVDMAKDCSQYTIPYLFSGATDEMYLRLNQSYGALLVNHLASQIMYALCPMDRPFFKLGLEPLESLGQLNNRCSTISVELQSCLSELESYLWNSMDVTQVRTSLHEIILQLLVSGNCLVYLDKLRQRLIVFSLQDYVVLRDSSHSVVQLILHRRCPIEQLQAQINWKKSFPPEVKEIDLYYSLQWCPDKKGGYWIEVHEVDDEVILNRQVAKDAMPYIPLALYICAEEHYGHSYVENYLSELVTLDSLNRATRDLVGHMAKNVLLVRPNGTTNLKDVQAAKNGSIIFGSSQDISVLNAASSNDTQLVLAYMEQIKRNLAQYFLFYRGMMRETQRVTAQELRYLHDYVEQALGGHIGSIAQRVQVPLVQLFIDQLAQSSCRDHLDLIRQRGYKIQIHSAFNQSGRHRDLENLSIFVQSLSQLSQFDKSEFIDIKRYAKRIAQSLYLSVDDLFQSSTTPVSTTDPLNTI